MGGEGQESHQNVHAIYAQECRVYCSGLRDESYLTIIRSLLPVVVYWFAWGPATLLVHNTVNHVFQLDSCQGNQLLPFEFFTLGVANVALAICLNGALRRGIGKW